MTVSTSRRSERRLAIVPASGRASSINRFNVSLSGLSQVKQTSVSVFDFQFPSSHRLLRFKKKSSCCFRRVPTVCRLSSSPFLKAHVCGFAFSQFSENIPAVPFAVVVRFLCSSSFADCLPARPRSYGRNIQPVEKHHRISRRFHFRWLRDRRRKASRRSARLSRSGTSSCLKTAVQIVTINSPSPSLFTRFFDTLPFVVTRFFSLALRLNELVGIRRRIVPNELIFPPSRLSIQPRDCLTKIQVRPGLPETSSPPFLYFFPPRSRLNESQLRPSLVPCTPVPIHRLPFVTEGRTIAIPKTRRPRASVQSTWIASLPPTT